MPGKAKQPAPKGRPRTEQANVSQQIAQLKQQVLALETKLAALLKEQEDRKKFFVAQ